MMRVGAFLALAMLLAPAGVSSTAPAAAGPKADKAPSTSSISSAVGLGSKWGVVTSVRRSVEHNRAVGGVPNSFHLSGRAIDIARRPGVHHSDIAAAYRKAGYHLIESLDEGDHSHFAFALPGAAPGDKPAQLAAAAPSPVDACATHAAPEGRRRPDRWDGCADPSDPKPALHPIEDSLP